MMNQIILIPCVIFLLNLVIVGVTAVATLYILMTSYNVISGMIAGFFYGYYEDNGDDNNE